MLTRAKKVKGYKLNATDGEIGSIKEFFFDDKYWTVRYLVASTGGWLNDQQVLISPYFLGNVNDSSKLIEVSLSRNEIENSPPWDTDKPVSRQFEESYYDYYGAPTYWSGPYSWGAFPYFTRDREKWRTSEISEKSWNPNLRSTKDVTDYYIQATDNEIGHVEDFIIDEETWTIRYLEIDTKNWLPGKKVLVSPEWIDRISWNESKVFINLSRDIIKNAPGYDEDKVITREYESRLYGYYNRPVYWAEEPVTREYYR